jgi:anti-sigma B factor antagonist
MASMSGDSDQFISVEVGEEAGTPVVSVVGEVDIATSEMLHTRVAAAVEAQSSDCVIIDLTQVGFIDSSGLAVLVSVANAGSKVVLRGASHTIRRVIEATGLTQILHLEGS